MLRMIVVVSVFVFSMCSKAEMSGKGGGNAAAPTPTPTPPPFIPSIIPSMPPNPTPAPNCDNAITQAKLLTPSVDLNVPDAHIDFEVYKTNCYGTVIDFTSDKMWFDMDAMDMEDTIPYDAESDSAMVSGNLNNISGEDMFGHTGKTWGHYETDKPMQIRGKAPSIRIRVKVGTSALKPHGEGSTTPAPYTSDPVTIPAYLKFGTATEATVAVSVILKRP